MMDFFNFKSRNAIHLLTLPMFRDRRQIHSEKMDSFSKLINDQGHCINFVLLRLRRSDGCRASC